MPDRVVSQGSSRLLADNPADLPTWVAAPSVGGRSSLIRMRSLGANLGATRANGFPRRRPDPDRRVAITPAHGPIRTVLNGLTGIYGSDGWVRVPQSVWARLTARIVARAVVALRVTAQLLTLRP